MERGAAGFLGSGALAVLVFTGNLQPGRLNKSKDDG
jgi:hypothetical protein